MRKLVLHTSILLTSILLSFSFSNAVEETQLENGFYLTYEDFLANRLTKKNEIEKIIYGWTIFHKRAFLLKSESGKGVKLKAKDVNGMYWGAKVGYKNFRFAANNVYDLIVHGKVNYIGTDAVVSYDNERQATHLYYSSDSFVGLEKDGEIYKLSRKNIKFLMGDKPGIIKFLEDNNYSRNSILEAIRAYNKK